MAYLPQSEKDKEEEQGQQSSGAPQLSTGSSMVGSGAFGGNTAARGPSSTGYVNLGRYLDANEPKIGGMAQKIGGRITGDYGKHKSDLENAETAFSAETTKDILPGPDESLLSGIRAGKVTKDQIALANQHQNATYKGPTDFTQDGGYQSASRGLSGVVTDRDSTSTVGGRKDLLTKDYSRNGSGQPYSDYSTGMRNLDQALLQQDKSAQGQFSNLRNTLAGTENLAGESLTRANQAVTDAETTIANNKTAVGDAVKEGEKRLRKNFDDLLNFENQDRLQAYNDMRNKISTSAFSMDPQYDPAFIEQFLKGQGITNITFNDLQNVGLDASHYLTRGQDANYADVLSEQDDMRARLEALQSLGAMGDINPGLMSDDTGYGFDKTRFTNDYQALLQAFLADQEKRNAHNAALNQPSGGGDHRTYLEKLGGNFTKSFSNTADIKSLL